MSFTERSVATEEAHRFRDMSDESSVGIGSDVALGGEAKEGGGFKSCWPESKLDGITSPEGFGASVA